MDGKLQEERPSMKAPSEALLSQQDYLTHRRPENVGTHDPREFE